MKTRVEAFDVWLKTAPAGQVYVYYTGFLSVDRGSIVDCGAGRTEFVPNEDVDDLGKLALSAFEANRVFLFQRKIHDKVYDYIAMKRYMGGRNW